MLMNFMLFQQRHGRIARLFSTRAFEFSIPSQFRDCEVRVSDACALERLNECFVRCL